ncbi:MAG: SDR family NAD(P)-dependent oxidoreductase [bacterium]|nr:SDR family NAD(P)-dependent oxidoreductase [bacterium]
MLIKQWILIGATSDIAKALIQYNEFEPHALMLCAKNSALLSQMVDDLKVRKPQVQTNPITIDLSQIEKVNWLASVIQKTFTEPYGIIYFAGILDDDETASKEKIIAMNHVNFLFPMLLFEEIFKNPSETKCQSIVVVGSVAGDRGRAKNYRYGATKAAIDTYLSGLRQRLFNFGIHVLTVKPGFVKTKMIQHLTKTPLAATPERVAKDIWKAIQKRKMVIYTPWFMRWILFILRHLPEKWFLKIKF